MNLARAWSQLRASAGIIHGSKAFGGPFQANINITNRCNVRCVHCYFHSPLISMPNYAEVRLAKELHKAPDKESINKLLTMQADTAKVNSLLDRLLEMGTRRFQLTGNGEPFTHPNMLDFIERVRRKGSYCLTNTNGTLLSRDKMEALLRLQFDDLRVTMMAGNRITYTRTHPGAPESMFDRLKENLIYLGEKKKSLGSKKPVVSLAYVIVSQNAAEIGNFIESAAEIRADQVIFRIFDNVNDPGYAPVVLSKEQGALVKQQFAEAAGFLDARNIRHNIRSVLQVFDAQLDTQALYRVIPCYYGWATSRIDVNGDVYPCCRCYVPLGNAFENDFSEIWHGAAYSKFRHAAVTINRRHVSAPGCDCGKCVHHNANVRIYRLLHPIKGRSSRLQRIRPNSTHEED